MTGWKTPSAVLFDCDGVLVDSEGITNRLLRDDLAQHGLEISIDEVMSIAFGGTMESVAAEALRRGAALPADWIDLFYRKMFAGLAEEVEAITGVAELLDALREAGVACAVASNGPRAKMDITLKRTGLFAYLDPHIYSSRDLAHPKPAPDVYLHAAAQLGVAKEDCVVLEDSSSGARAAQAARMRCIGFVEAGQARALEPVCDIVLEDMISVQRQLGL